MSTFPSVISTISNPQPTNKLNSPSHSSIESAQNDAISKLETFIGTLSSVQGTIMYDVRAAASGGGGHVQAANMGGTGQTAFSKGDILVSASSSVLSKLAVGSNTQVLTADSTQILGVKWSAVSSIVSASSSSNNIATYDVSTASGNQTIAHNLGRTPVYVKVTAFLQSTSTTCFSYGGSDGTNNRCNFAIAVYTAGALTGVSDSGHSASSSKCVVLGIDAAGNNNQQGTINFDGTNVTITWIKTGTLTGTGNILIESN